MIGSSNMHRHCGLRQAEKVSRLAYVRPVDRRRRCVVFGILACVRIVRTTHRPTSAAKNARREPFYAFASIDIACWKLWNFNPPRIGACLYVQKNRSSCFFSSKIIADGDINHHIDRSFSHFIIVRGIWEPLRFSSAVIHFNFSS